jgi:hypothetical protein
MRRRSGGAVIGAVVAAAMVFGQSASASASAVTVGNTCGATTSEGNGTIVSLKNPPGYPLPSAIPSSGIITSWTFSLAKAVPNGIYQEQLKVLAPTGADEFTVVGESELSPVGTGANIFPARIPVRNGELLGSMAFGVAGGIVEQGYFFCATADPGDEIALLPGDPLLGTTVTAIRHTVEAQNPISVTVEPDADGDGFGDETQDKCPTDASTQGACPKPAASITLSASAAAKRGLVTVTLTSSAQATVTVAGSVKLGKGKSAKLSGGTQIVAPGSLAKFSLLFPAKLKARLKQLPPSKKLSLSLSASAPGATTTNFIVKVPGQKKPARSHRHRG